MHFSITANVLVYRLSGGAFGDQMQSELGFGGIQVLIRARGTFNEFLCVKHRSISHDALIVPFPWQPCSFFHAPGFRFIVIHSRRHKLPGRQSNRRTTFCQVEILNPDRQACVRFVEQIPHLKVWGAWLGCFSCSFGDTRNRLPLCAKTVDNF